MQHPFSTIKNFRLCSQPPVLSPFFQLYVPSHCVCSRLPPPSSLPPAVLLTVTMSEVKRRSKAAARSGHATATAVVSAIGQRVQDTASFYAINATIEQKQKEYSSQRRYDRAHFRPRSDAGQGLEGLSGFEASGGGSDADDLQGGVTELDVYNQKMHQVGA